MVYLLNLKAIGVLSYVKPKTIQRSLMLSTLSCYVSLFLVLSAQCLGKELTRNLIYRQIVSHQYSLENSDVPEKTRSNLSRPASKEVKTLDGIRWRASAQGLVETDPSGKTKIWTPKNGLPMLPLTSIATGPEGWIWLGTPGGAICFRPNAPTRERWFYFWGRRYLADNDIVNLIAQPHRVWIRTRAGVSLIEFNKFTLEQKSTLIDNRLHECPDRYGLVADSQLLRPGDPTSCHPDSNDNDGLWTSLYVASECFRFSVTHSPEALHSAHHSLRALERLLSITGIPGFPARSFIRQGEGGDTGGGEWHWTADRAWRWKGDTSNDELVGHYLAYSVAYDLLPPNDVAERKAIRQAVQSITDGLIRHGFRLVGYGNRVTRWGDYSPQYFATPEGEAEAGTALELLSLLRTAYHITGDPKFLDAYHQIVEKYGYVQHVMRGAAMLSKITNANYSYSDEELNFLSFYPLLKYEDNPVLVRQYRQALTFLWLRAESEHNPLWDYIYAVGTGANNYGSQEALETLERIPLDMTWWTVHNSQRLDLPVAAELDRSGAKQSERVIPPDQRCITKWNSNPFQLDCDLTGGRDEDDGTIFLLPYWMGRYYHLLPH